MKKLILLITVISLSHTAFAQTLQQHNLTGLHIITIHLKPNVTLDYFTNFFTRSAIPEYETQFHNKGYLIKCVRGEPKKSIGVM